MPVFKWPLEFCFFLKSHRHQLSEEVVGLQHAEKFRVFCFKKNCLKCFCVLFLVQLFQFSLFSWALFLVRMAFELSYGSFLIPRYIERSLGICCSIETKEISTKDRLCIGASD